MSNEKTPRRAEPDGRSRAPVLVSTAILGTLALGAGVFVVANQGSEASSGNQTCAQASRIAVDPAWSAAVTKAAAAYHDKSKTSCEITVTEEDSASVAKKGLTDQAAWIPEDPAWLEQSQGLTGASAVDVATSPLVLVTRTEDAKALGTPLPKATLMKMLSGEQTWVDHGHADWGKFRLLLPTVNSTVAGAAAFGSLTEMAGASASSQISPIGGTTPASLAQAKVQQRLVPQVPLKDVTSKLGVVESDATAVNPAASRTGVTTEVLALDVKDVQATYLDTHSGLTMSVVNASNSKEVSDFTTWLQSADGQKALASAGARTLTQKPDADKVKALGLPATAPRVGDNTVEEMTAARTLLAATSRRTAAFSVLDISGSMAQPLDSNTSMSKLDLMVKTTMGVWGSFPDGMATGLMTFHATADQAEKPVIQTVLPLTRNDSLTWVTDGTQMQQALANIKPEGGTPLYQATLAGMAYMQKNYMPGMNNTLLVITDGASQDAADEPSLEQFLAKMPKQDPKKPIKVMYVAFGADADYSSLQKIAKATNQKAVKITSAAELQAMLPLLFQ